MIQINLIPDVKQEYLRARRVQATAVSLSIMVSIGAIALVVVMGLILLAQIGRESLADGRIDSEYKKLANTPDIGNILTIQNQLSLISDQHHSKIISSRLFGLVQGVNPPAPHNIQFTSVQLDAVNKRLILDGVAVGGYPSVETLTKSLSNTKIEYMTEGESQASSVPLASRVEVTQTSFGQNPDGARVLSFTLTLDVDESLLSNMNKETRIVTPSQRVDVTDSKQRVPDSLFTAPATNEEDN